jgi:uncharacterized membrane protein YfcA
VGAGALVQSAVGFGFALLSAPVLTAAFGPRASVSAIASAGLLVTLLTLTAERRPREVLGRRTLVMVLASIPGMVAGALLLRDAPIDLLRVLVGAAVLAAVAITARARPREPHGRGWGGAATAGVLSGALATSTGMNGPPLVLHLLHRGATPTQTRDTLSAVFLVSGVLMLAALVAAGAFRPPGGVAWLIAIAVGGQLAGRRAFALLRPRYRAVTLAVLVASALAGLVPVVQALV